MKTETMNTTTQDRLATCEEVRRATSSTQDRVLELCNIQGNYCQMDSDLGGIIRYPAEEFEFFAYLSEMDESVRKLNGSVRRRQFAFGTSKGRFSPNWNAVFGSSRESKVDLKQAHAPGERIISVRLRHN